MTGVSAQLLLQLEPALQGYILLFARVSGVFFSLPVFGQRSLPVRVKVALAFVVAVMLGPIVEAKVVGQGFVRMTVLLGVELMIGVGLGLILRFFVMSLLIAGAIASQATSLAQLLGPNSPEPSPAVGMMLFLSGMTLAIMMGAHTQFIIFIAKSYALIPLGAMPSAAEALGVATDHFETAFALAFSLSLSFLGVSAVYNILLGVVNRAMPQMMVALVGAPLIVWLSIVVLLVSGPIIADEWAREFLLRLTDFGRR